MKDEYKAVNHDTWTHIHNVRSMLMGLICVLTQRAQQHDLSKLADPEVSTFAEYTPKLKGVTYGSPEYKQFLAEMSPALENHYACNPHHPEHYSNGVMGMTLIDVLEMLVDWKASGLRHDDGDPARSIQLNMERFGLSLQLAQIMYNTLGLLEQLDCSLLDSDVRSVGTTVTVLVLGSQRMEMPAWIAREFKMTAEIEPFRVVRYVKPVNWVDTRDYRLASFSELTMYVEGSSQKEESIGVNVYLGKHRWYRAPHHNFWMYVEPEVEE